MHEKLAGNGLPVTVSVTLNGRFFPFFPFYKCLSPSFTVVFSFFFSHHFVMSSPQSQNNVFRQQQHLYRSSHYLAKSKSPPVYTPPVASEASSDWNKGRKRRVSEDEEMGGLSNDPSPPTEDRSLLETRPTIDRMLHLTKRNRLGVQKQFPITKLLATLNKDKLIELINDLVDSNPHLQREIDAHIPPPTTQSVSLVIGNLEKKLADSFPLNKNPQGGKDDYTFNRVKGPLMDVVNALLEYADHFTSSSDEFPTTIFSYLHYATCVAHRLPTWDNDAHNQIKRDLYSNLVSYWKKAIDIAATKAQQGKIYGQQMVTEWARQLASHNAETQGLFDDVIHAFTVQLGWIIGIEKGVSDHHLFRAGGGSDVSSSLRRTMSPSSTYTPSHHW
ncbi:Cut8 six-helix bundle-domain-containing protein [Radiomyces spectabilis]|uniref:Cut8 six-helix bundle-domain-containing protein n=1 Tax=Radiomyces spectabilis TaxID=64574 RepID=UPI0022201B6F|nr:Cut8 six-helix bundle-domain-containing protein [Radiomyces spectabilis]KAI8376298.1 Cut8 six-helix bundle-domain-containing protein [Radiomyces spectabilis]